VKYAFFSSNNFGFDFRSCIQLRNIIGDNFVVRENRFALCADIDEDAFFANLHNLAFYRAPYRVIPGHTLIQ